MRRIACVAAAFGTVALVASSAHATVANTVTGGGTVIVASGTQTVLASFGLDGRVPSAGSSETVGRITYDEVNGLHVDVPVTSMTALTSPTPGPNGTGGTATLVGDCSAAGATCPSGVSSVRVDVEDNADSGAGTDVFQISFCSDHVGTICAPPKGGPLRSGDIQVQ